MARLNPPSSTAVVDVPDEQVEAFKAQGWTGVRVEQVPVLLEKPDEVEDQDEAEDPADEQEETAEEVPELEAPRGNASLEDWATYAMSKGVAGETLDGLKQSEIRALFAEK